MFLSHACSVHVLNPQLSKSPLLVLESRRCYCATEKFHPCAALFKILLSLHTVIFSYCLVSNSRWMTLGFGVLHFFVRATVVRFGPPVVVNSKQNCFGNRFSTNVKYPPPISNGSVTHCNGHAYNYRTIYILLC